MVPANGFLGGGHVDLAENGKGFQLHPSNLEMREFVASGLRKWDTTSLCGFFWIVIEMATRNQCSMDYKPCETQTQARNDAICEQ